MLTCDTARELLALDPTSDDAALQAHLGSCSICSIYARRTQALDRVLSRELRWEAPADLTARLLSIAAAPALIQTPARPSRWFVALVYGLTLAIVALSLAVAVQVVGLLTAQLGLADMLTELVALPARALQQLSLALPESRYAIDAFLRIRDQLIWLLAAALVWATFDRYGRPAQAHSRAV